MKKPKKFEVYPGLIASTFLVAEDNNFWQIFLWNKEKDLKRWSKKYSHDDYCEGTIGLHSPNSFGIEEEIKPVPLGYIHFVNNKWNTEVVTHELLHALFHYIKGCIKDFARRFYWDDMDLEEYLCYSFGEWNDEIYRWLWRHNPGRKWRED
jgi:hypothetical protein